MLTIRSETPHDYPAIAGVNLRAFGERLEEALIVTLHRHSPLFDPTLSLVAELDGEIVGHALFTPRTIRLVGQDVQAVNLAPIAVDPAYQRKGIGGVLINEGHSLARSKGYAVSFLLGHPTYYPRFGYKTHAFGAASIEVRASALSKRAPVLQTQRPTEADIPTLHALWQREESNVDFAIDPGHSLLDWISPNPRIKATVYLRDGEIVGYTRLNELEPYKPRVFLAHDAETAHWIAAQLINEGQSLALPLHPYSASVTTFGTPKCESWEPAMAYDMASDIFEEYYSLLQRQKRQPGRPIWPVAFDLEM
jgi:predicted N-acetyltransferase YhbS